MVFKEQRMGTMGRKNLLLNSLLSIVLSAAFVASALKDSKNSESTQSAIIHKKAITLCPVLQKVIEKDGAFDSLSWKICTSGSCEDKHSTWGWLGGMNNERKTTINREGIRITSEGALEIKKVRLSDAGHYMCTVERINHTSAKRHFVTLTVSIVGNATDDQERKATNKTDPLDYKNGNATDDQERKGTNKTDPLDYKKEYSDGSGNVGYLITTCLLSVLLVLAVGYIAYLKRSDLRCGNHENDSV